MVGCVTVAVCVAVLVDVSAIVFVTFGLRSKSPPMPNPTPTTPTAASAPVHFNTFLLETDPTKSRDLTNLPTSSDIFSMKVETGHDRSFTLKFKHSTR